jgi:hypothetical protein
MFERIFATARSYFAAVMIDTPVIRPVEFSMTQSGIENELRALRSDVKEIVDRAQSREDEWRRLGLVSMISGIA